MIGKVIFLLILTLIGTYSYLLYSAIQSKDTAGIIIVIPFLLFTLVISVREQLWTLWKE